MKVLSVLTALLLSFPNFSASSQTSAPAPSNSPQAATLLTQSAAALTGHFAGSDLESGAAAFEAPASGAGRKQGSRLRAFHGHHLNGFCVEWKFRRLRR